MSEAVAVTGAAGFIGRWVIDELLARDYTVVGLDDLSNGSRDNLAAFEDDDRFRFQQGDVRERSDVEALLSEETAACITLQRRSMSTRVSRTRTHTSRRR